MTLNNFPTSNLAIFGNILFLHIPFIFLGHFCTGNCIGIPTCSFPVLNRTMSDTEITDAEYSGPRGQRVHLSCCASLQLWWYHRLSSLENLLHNHHWKFLSMSLLLVLLCFGLKFAHPETDFYKLWVGGKSYTYFTPPPRFFCVQPHLVCFFRKRSTLLGTQLPRPKSSLWQHLLPTTDLGPLPSSCEHRPLRFPFPEVATWWSSGKRVHGLHGGNFTDVWQHTTITQRP